LRSIDFAALFNTYAPIHLIIPIAVIDELDGLKQRGDSHARWRAGHALGVFDEIFRLGATRSGVVRAASPMSEGAHPAQPGEVTAEIVLDSPGHLRLPIMDDEIIDRALTVQGLAGRPVTLVTYDTNQSTRAFQAGLQVLNLRTPIGDEPKQEDRQPGKRRPSAPADG
jgi:predicted ribonuclease YlaK